MRCSVAGECDAVFIVLSRRIRRNVDGHLLVRRIRAVGTIHLRIRVRRCRIGADWLETAMLLQCNAITYRNWWPPVAHERRRHICLARRHTAVSDGRLLIVIVDHIRHVYERAASAVEMRRIAVKR